MFMAPHSRSGVRGTDQYSGCAETLAGPRTPPPEAGLVPPILIGVILTG
jgi:hypothetical protein